MGQSRNRIFMGDGRKQEGQEPKFIKNKRTITLHGNKIHMVVPSATKLDQFVSFQILSNKRSSCIRKNILIGIPSGRTAMKKFDLIHSFVRFSMLKMQKPFVNLFHISAPFPLFDKFPRDDLPQDLLDQ